MYKAEMLLNEGFSFKDKREGLDVRRSAPWHQNSWDFTKKDKGSSTATLETVQKSRLQSC